MMGPSAARGRGLLGLLLLLLLLPATGLAVVTNSSTSTPAVGGSVASGPAGRNASRSIAPSASAATTRTGLASAERCASASASYTVASMRWSQSHSRVTFITTTEPGYTYTAVSPRYHAASVTTLCDGHPRVVGTAAQISGTRRIDVSASITSMSLTVYGDEPYPSPAPNCTINARDCQALYNVNTSLVDIEGFAICSFTTAPLATTFSTNSLGAACSGCYILASAARLLYWPVRTEDGSGDLCSGTAKLLTGTPTGSGPNTVVTEGVTITSPSVGISFASISRNDGCFTTVASTIVVVPPEEVSSIRGARALFQHRPFAFQDLNYRCHAANSSTYYIQDGPGEGCYQEVPAEAYFSGRSAFEWDENYPASIYSRLTIGDDYRPYVLPPGSMTDWANSAWGTSCAIYPDGVWDPPKALTQEGAMASPTVPSAATTATHSPSSTPPVPAEPDHTQPAQTSAPAAGAGPTTTEPPATAGTSPVSSPTTPYGPAHSADPGQSWDDPPSAHTDSTATPTTGDGGAAGSPDTPPGVVPAPTNGGDGASQTSASSAGPESSSTPSDQTPNGPTDSVFTIGSQTYAQLSAGPSSVAIVNGRTTATIVISGAATTIGSHIVSAEGSGNLVWGVGADRTTIFPAGLSPSAAETFQLGSDDYTVASAVDGRYVVQNGQSTFTLNTGAAAVTAGGERFSAGSDGVIIQSGMAKTTVAVHAPTAGISQASPLGTVEVGSKDFSVMQLSNSAYVLEDSSTMITLISGGPAVTVANEVLTAGSAGVVPHSGHTAETITAGTSDQSGTAGATSPAPVTTPPSASAPTSAAQATRMDPVVFSMALLFPLIMLAYREAG